MKNVIRIINGEGITLIAKHPISILKMKPNAIQNASIISMFFKINEYKIFINIYVNMQNTDGQFNSQAKYKLNANKKRIKIIATFLEIKFAAIGLKLFIGCSLSFSISIKSLNMYMQDEMQQKEIKAYNTLIHKGELNKFIEKINGTITTKFFI